jgi:hypothetical protein
VMAGARSAPLNRESRAATGNFVMTSRGSAMRERPITKPS